MPSVQDTVINGAFRWPSWPSCEYCDNEEAAMLNAGRARWICEHCRELLQDVDPEWWELVVLAREANGT